jgi:glycosyltransferase involved in cell wall biosynthesis
MILKTTKPTSLPLVSVIIPSLPHRKESLERAIASVRAQSYPNIEIIVEFGGHNAQEARNIAASRAKGKYLAFLDDDDEFYPTKIEKQVKKLEANPAIRLCITWLDDYRFNNYRQSRPKEWWSFKELLRGFNISCTTSFMIRKKTFNVIGHMDETLNDGHEYDLALRVAEKYGKYSIYCIQESLCRMNAPKGGNMSDDFSNKIHGQFQMINKWGKHYSLIRWFSTFGCTCLFILGWFTPWSVHKFFALVKNKTDKISEVFRYQRPLRDDIAYGLTVIKKIFDANDIHFWLEGGTLIAAMRDPSRHILEWDNDGDVSFDIKDIYRIHSLKSEFKEYGLQLKGFLSYKVMIRNTQHLVCVMPSHISKGYYVKTRNAFAILYNYIEKRFLPLELFITYPFLRFFNRFKTYSFIRGKKDWVEPFAYVEFCGDIFPIPFEVEKYLTFRFGNWLKEDRYVSDTKLNGKYHKRWGDI